jgi:hypothetical protein
MSGTVATADAGIAGAPVCARRGLAWTPARIAAAVLGLYLGLTTLAYVSLRVHPAYTGARGAALLGHHGRLFDFFVAPWVRWDSFFFTGIAAHGYPHGVRLTSFYPGYPALVRAAAAPLGARGLAFDTAAVIVSVLATMLALVALHAMVRGDLGAGLADRTVTYALLAPMTFFFLAPYSEGLFLLFSVVSLLAMRRGHTGWAALAAAAAAVTRPPGVLLVVPLAWEAYRRSAGARARLGAALWLLLPVAAFAAWYAVAALVIGASPSDSERAFGAGPALPWAGLVDTLSGLVAHPAALLNTVAVLLTIAGGVALVRWRRVIPLSYGLVVLVALVPMVFRHGPSYNPWLSADRFAAVVFPLYVALAWWTRARPHLHRAYLVVSPVLLAAAFSVYTYNRFVG